MRGLVPLHQQIGRGRVFLAGGRGVFRFSGRRRQSAAEGGKTQDGNDEMGASPTQNDSHGNQLPGVRCPVTLGPPAVAGHSHHGANRYYVAAGRGFFSHDVGCSCRGTNPNMCSPREDVKKLV